MTMQKISGGVAHQMPADLKKSLLANPKAVATWGDLTPLARNEWICWIISVKQQKTRDEHIDRGVADLKAGKRRPCCWMGCIHRKDKPMNASQKYILGKRSRRKA